MGLFSGGKRGLTGGGGTTPFKNSPMNLSFEAPHIAHSTLAILIVKTPQPGRNATRRLRYFSTRGSTYMGGPNWGKTFVYALGGRYKADFLTWGFKFLLFSWRTMQRECGNSDSNKLIKGTKGHLPHILGAWFSLYMIYLLHNSYTLIFRCKLLVSRRVPHGRWKSYGNLRAPLCHPPREIRSPGKLTRNLKAPNWKAKSSSKPSFSGSMLIFQGVIMPY